MTARMDKTLHDLETQLIRKPGQCADLLGLSPSAYFGYKNSDKPLPAYVRLHAELLLRIPGDLLLQLERERIGGR
jgi:hypothetical protein